MTSSSLFRVIGISAVLATTSGCMTWGGTRPLNPEQMTEPRSSAVRVILTDQSRVVLYSPQVVGETLVGNVGQREGARQVLPVSEVKGIQTRRIGVLRTAGAAVLGYVALLAYALANFAG